MVQTLVTAYAQDNEIIVRCQQRKCIRISSSGTNIYYFFWEDFISFEKISLKKIFIYFIKNLEDFYREGFFWEGFFQEDFFRECFAKVFQFLSRRFRLLLKRFRSISRRFLGSCFTLTAMLHDLYDLHALMAIHDFSYLWK